MHTKIITLLITLALLVAVTACSGANATGAPPTLASEPTRTSAPPIVITATTAATTAPVATNTAPPPTNTAGPTLASATNTVAAANTRPPATATRPLVTTTATVNPIKYVAPSLVEPNQGAVREYGKVDLVFIWTPVGDLDPKECYEIDLIMVNTADNHQVGKSYQTGCGQSASQGNIRFVLYKRGPAENYIGLAAEAQNPTSANSLLLHWSIRVVLQVGADTWVPVSPPSQTSDLTLNNVQ